MQIVNLSRLLEFLYDTKRLSVANCESHHKQTTTATKDKHKILQDRLTCDSSATKEGSRI